MKIGLVYELPAMGHLAGRTPPAPDLSAEWASDDEIETLAQTLRALGHSVEHIGDFEALVRYLAGAGQVDLVFNYAAGIYGQAREAQVPALLEGLRLPYTGADPVSLTLCLDKAVTKRLWQAAGLPTPEFITVAEPEDLERQAGSLPDFPLFVKPAREGSSKGISVRSRVEDRAALAERVGELLDVYAQPVLVEAYLPGREFSVAVVGGGRAARVLGAAEIAPGPGGVLGVAEKKAFQPASFLPVADPDLRQALCALGLQGYRAVDCQVIGRLDIRLDAHGRPNLLEINPNPGLHPERSITPAIARQAGLSYTDLIALVIRLAQERQRTVLDPERH